MKNTDGNERTQWAQTMADLNIESSDGPVSRMEKRLLVIEAENDALSSTTGGEGEGYGEWERDFDDDRFDDYYLLHRHNIRHDHKAIKHGDGEEQRATALWSDDDNIDNIMDEIDM